MNSKTRFTLAAAVAVAGFACNTTANAQSADTLIDKLVSKGILTANEARELREESDKDFKTAVQAKNGMPDWVNSFKINGDFRGRYESFKFNNPTTVDRNRFRYRARLGFTANMLDNLEVGMRLTSTDPSTGLGYGGDPISGNTTFASGGSKKFVYFDAAYAKWTPIKTAEWLGTLTVGKMDNPFVFPSTMMFDKDYTPEGATFEITHRFNADQSLKFTGGGFALNETSGNNNNPYVAGTQLRWDAKWNTKISTSLAGSVWSVAAADHLSNTNSVPDQNSGNSRSGGNLQYNFTPVQADASVTYTLDSFPLYPLPCPVTAFGEFIHNTAAAANNNAYAFGLTLGKSGKKGTWDLGYQYRHMEGDSWYEEFTESDFGANYITSASLMSGGKTGYRSGTNVKGHILRLQYSPYDSFTIGVTYWLSNLINASPAGSRSGTGRLQVDANFKF